MKLEREQQQTLHKKCTHLNERALILGVYQHVFHYEFCWFPGRIHRYVLMLVQGLFKNVKVLCCLSACVFAPTPPASFKILLQLFRIITGSKANIGKTFSVVYEVLLSEKRVDVHTPKLD